MVQGKTIAFVAVCVVAASAILISSGAGARSGAAASSVATGTWNPRAAATYLDQRQSWWESWPKSARDHGTVCVSCHTALPYALARPELRAVLHENDATTQERKILGDVTTRVRAWSEVKPYYGDTTPDGRTKAIESRGTEAVLNALVLASRDERSSGISAEARQAFANMFALQQTTGDDAGAWTWLNFGLRPWEAKTSVYFGAALAAIAIGMEPQNYGKSKEIQPNVERLRAYLRERLDQPLWRRVLRRDDPQLFNRAMLLWASTKLPGLISRDAQRSIVGTLGDAQQPDGAWRFTSLGHWRSDASESADSSGDGLATGLVTYALEQAGSSPNEQHVSRALAWLASHQEPATGMWRAWSLNKQRDPATNVGKFMSDAATAYAVLALSAGAPNARVERSARDSKATADLLASHRPPLRQ
jgi:squalene-hopene/tetraprenyl-beta-curcumene cyclase